MANRSINHNVSFILLVQIIGVYDDLCSFQRTKIANINLHNPTQTARLLKINRNTINKYYLRIRQSRALHQEQQMKQFHGEIELDESYFGGKHKGNVGRSTKSKIPVFGILKRNGKVYTQIVPDVSSRTLKAIIKSKIKEGSIIYSDSWKSYDGLVFHGFDHHRINHYFEYVNEKNHHINGIESFWAFAKTKLTKYYGIRPKYFYLYLKECEYRFKVHPTISW